MKSLTCLSLNSLICASDASSCFLLLGFPEAEAALRGGFSTDFWGEVDGGRVGPGGEGTDRGLGEEQRERGRCWGEGEEVEEEVEVGSSLGGLGEAVLAFGGEVVRAMGEEEEEGEGDSLRLWASSASGLAPAARPVDWITLKCWCGSARDLDLCRARAGGEAEGSMGTRVGGWDDALLSRGSARPGFAAPGLGVAT